MTATNHTEHYEMDSQHPDDYNIVRAGTPTRSTETEESSHE